MKKIFAVLLCALVVFTLVCCNAEKKIDENDTELTHETDEVFENAAFLEAFAAAVGKAPADVTPDDAQAIHYIAIYPAEDGSFELSVADKDAADLLFGRKFDEFEARIKTAKYNFVENENIAADLGMFKNIEMFEFVDFPITDVSFVNNYGILSVGVFNNNGITDVSSLAKYNPASLAELDFTGNNIHDWAPLMHIKEKVRVLYTTTVSLTLADFVNPDDSASSETPDSETPENEVTEETDENDQIEFVDENGAPVDFGALFD